MRSNSTGRGPILAAAVVGVMCVSQLRAASETWSAAPADSNFANGVNWTPDGVPPGDTTTTTNTDTATFGTTSNTAVTVDANRNLQNITFNSTSSIYTLSGGSLVLTGGGALLTTNNTQTIAATTPITIAGDGVAYAFTSNVASTNRQFVINSNVTGSSTAGNTTTLTLNGGSGSASAQGVFGVISDGAAGGKLALVKSGANTWSINGSVVAPALPNTYSGGTTLNGGTLRMAAAGNSTAGIGSGALTLNAGTLFLGSSTSNNFNNALVVNSPVAAATTGFVSFRANSTFAPTSLTGTGQLGLYNGAGAAAGLVLTATDFKGFAGVIDAATGTLRFGAGITGLDQARLNVGSAATFVSANFGSNNNVNVAIGALSGVGTFGTNTAGTGTITYVIGTRAEDTTYAGTIINSLTRNALTKVGANALTLTGVNTYAGNTTVTGGTLALSVSGSIAASPTITVGAAGTLDTTGLTGGANFDSANSRFTLASGQTLALSGTFRGTLAAVAAITPGAAATIGAANVNSTVLVAGSTFTADVGTTASDVLNVVGTIDLGGATLTLNNLGSPTAIGQLFTLVANDGADETTGTFAGLADGATIASGADSYTIRYNAFGGNDVTLTALTGGTTVIPEPASLAAVGLAGSLLLKRRRRA